MLNDDLIKTIVLQELLSQPILKVKPRKRTLFEKLMNKINYYKKDEVDFLIKEAKIGANQFIEIPRFENE